METYKIVEPNEDIKLAEIEITGGTSFITIREIEKSIKDNKAIEVNLKANRDKDAAIEKNLEVNQPDLLAKVKEMPKELRAAVTLYELSTEKVARFNKKIEQVAEAIKKDEERLAEINKQLNINVESK